MSRYTPSATGERLGSQSQSHCLPPPTTEADKLSNTEQCTPGQNSGPQRESECGAHLAALNALHSCTSTSNVPRVQTIRAVFRSNRVQLSSTVTSPRRLWNRRQSALCECPRTRT